VLEQPVEGRREDRRRLAMTIDDAVAFAVEDELPPRPVALKTETQTPLTKGLEIARLIADDMSYHEIATRLFLSERTVEMHVTHMFNKLGLNSRIELSRWLASVSSAEPTMAGKNVS
jgi:DNA-binding NarL/FixJ family response regulator